MAATNEGFVDSETFRELIQAGAALYVGAYEHTAGQVTDFPPGTTDEMASSARHTATAALAIQALLAGSPLNVDGVMLVMGVVAGSLLGQAPMADHQRLFNLFQDQYAKTLAQVSLSKRVGLNG